MSEKISTIIIDDEPEARRFLEGCIMEDNDWQVLAVCNDGQTAVQKISELKPEVIFLDIQMPGMNGFEVVQQLKDHFPSIVFVTAYEEYAVKAFEVNALDYLLKPFSRKRLLKTLKRCKKNRNEINKNEKMIRKILEQLDQKKVMYPDKIPVKEKEKTILLEVDGILYLEGYDNYIKLHTHNKVYIIRNTLKEMEKKLNPKKFVRIHKSYIVNIQTIKAIEPFFHGEYIIHLEKEVKLKLTRSYRHNLEKIINQ